MVNTHFHSDHSYGNSVFADPSTTIISHAEAKNYMTRYSEKVLVKADVYMGLDKEEMEGTRIVYPDLTFSDQMQIDLGDLLVDLIFKGHSHTKGSIMAYVPSQKAIFTGDILFTDYYPNMGGSDVPGWVETLNFINSLDVEKIIPGHGPLSTKQKLIELSEFLTLFDDQAKTLATNSNDIKQVAAELKKSMPEKNYGERMITSSLKWKYMRKKPKTKK